MSSTEPNPTPALPPPPGVTSNFDHPDSLKRLNNIAIGVAIPILTIVFGLRVYTRIWIRRSWIFEDWLVSVAYVGTISFCGTTAATMDHYAGRHEWDITSAEAREASYWFNISSIHYGVAICIAKVSILWLYRRVFSPIRYSRFDMLIVFLIVILCLFYTATNIAKIWECVPREKIFDPKIPGHCINTSTLLVVSGLFNTITDFIILFLPIQAVWGMQMNLRNKLTVVLVFTFGLSAPAFSLVGVIVRARGSDNPDKTWVQPEILQWALAELTTAVLCACFPELGPLWRRQRTQTGPTASISNGQYRLTEGSSRRKTSNGLSTTTTLCMAGGLENSPYVELTEDRPYRTQVAVRNTGKGGNSERERRQITVTQEVRVDSATIEV
ncbi:hypothetical protein GGR51DRAFT_578051 [Nemania sp. FL0031]|nr:hypothetical protein GGR51DRAFT_578051 [Nemania sp. FL0031]